MSDDTHDVIYLQYMVHDITWDSERQDPNDVQYIHIKHFHRLLKNLDGNTALDHQKSLMKKCIMPGSCWMNCE